MEPLAPGTHLCAFYRGSREREEILGSYLAAGVGDGKRCLCVVDESEADAVRAGLRLEEVDVLPHTSVYLRGGKFSCDDVLEFWNERGSSFARVAGDARWASRDLTSLDELLLYESELNRFLAGRSLVVACLYDLDLLSSGVLSAVIRLHPKVLLWGAVLDNASFVQPDDDPAPPPRR